MTLVIAQRKNDQVSLSSDSRLSFGNAGHIDFAIKTFSVPVKIYSPTPVETNITELHYDHHLGLAITGSAINAYTVKESVAEMLQHLQYLPGHTDTSMYGIANLILKVYRKTTLDLAPILQRDVLGDLILCGYCSEENKLRIFHFSCETTAHSINPTFQEILQDDGMLFYGSGRQEGERIAATEPALSPLQILRRVVRSGVVASVGGGLQYGDFNDDQNFRVQGVLDYELNEHGHFKEYNFTLRGINIYKDDFERETEDYHISYPMQSPFEKDIWDIMRKSFGNDF